MLSILLSGIWGVCLWKLVWVVWCKFYAVKLFIPRFGKLYDTHCELTGSVVVVVYNLLATSINISINCLGPGIYYRKSDKFFEKDVSEKRLKNMYLKGTLSLHIIRILNYWYSNNW